MPPGRPPKRSRPSHFQSAPSPIALPPASPDADTPPTNRSPQASSPSHPSTSVLSASHPGHPLTPLLDTTFSTHRLSPLHIGSHPLTQDRMHILSHRLRDFLVGHVVRGVEVGLTPDRPVDDGAMSSTGALEAVAIAWVTLDGLVGPSTAKHHHRDGQDRHPMPVDGSSGHGQAGDESELSTSTSTSTGASPSPAKMRALQISLQYEHAECAALLLPSARSAATSNTVLHRAPSPPDDLLNFDVSRPDDRDPSFLHLPLLLLRMPAPLKAAISAFLSRTFDCRVSPLSLGTRSLVRALETWTSELGPENNANSSKDVVLTLGFHPSAVTQCRRRRRQKQQDAAHTDQTGWQEEDAPEKSDTALGLKSIDIIIPSAHHLRFIAAARAHESGHDATQSQAPDRREMLGAVWRDPHIDSKRRKLGGDKDEEGWTWRRWPANPGDPGSRSDSGPLQPFIEALSQYVQQHLALDMFHPAVRISKIACGGFVLSEGRVKIFGTSPSGDNDDGIPDAKQRASWGVLGVLLEKARIHLPDEKPRGEVCDRSDMT